MDAETRLEGLKTKWSGTSLGEVPDSVVARTQGVSIKAVSTARRALGIPAFVGFILTQEGVPTRSLLEAKYDAYLHWKKIPHRHEVDIPALSVVVDFDVEGLGLIEIEGMSGFARYDKRQGIKRAAYAQAGVPVTWITGAKVEELYNGCPLDLLFRKRTCSKCGKTTRDPANGMCRPCNRRQWGKDNAEKALCLECERYFERGAGSPRQKFCSRVCYAKSLAFDWPPWDVLDAKLATISAIQLASELGVTQSALSQRIYRRKIKGGEASIVRKNFRNKLTEDDVRKIRLLHANGSSQSDLCKQFGMAPATANQIVHFRSWKHVV
jgi:hypothetical protein